MALDVFFRSDLQSTLLAGIVSIIETSHAHGTSNLEYIRGAMTAYQHQALVFGISWTSLLNDARQALGQDFVELLESAMKVIE